MRLRTLVIVSLIAGLQLMPFPATAGGWWSSIDLRGAYLGIGETVTVRSEVMFNTLGSADKAREGRSFHAYLARGVDRSALNEAMSVPEPKRWWTPPRELTLIGDVQLSNWNSNLAVATAELKVPDMTPGSYALMLCSAGCRTPLANLIPLRVHVSVDPVAARTARKLVKTNDRLNIAFARVRRDLKKQYRQLTARSADSVESAESISRLQDGVIALETEVASLQTEAPSVPWPSYLMFFVAGAASVLLIMRLRRRSPALLDAPITQIPDDARELTSIPR